MKKIIYIIITTLLLTSFTSAAPKKQSYSTLGSYIYQLVNASEIQVYFIRAPKISEYFGDVKGTDYYAGAFINAAVSGILDFPKTKIYPWKWINVKNAKLYMDKAYKSKTNTKVSISTSVFNELKKQTKYKNLKDTQYVTSQMEKDIISIYKNKIAEYKNSLKLGENKINFVKEINNENLKITIDWGEKKTGGYALNIIGARELDGTIEVYYTAKEPTNGQMTTQAITYPKDTIWLKVKDIKKDYNVVLIETKEKLNEEVKYFIQTVDNKLRVTLSMGEKTTGGYGVNIIDGREIGDKIMIKYSAKQPGENDIVTQEINHPSASIDISLADLKRKMTMELIGIKNLEQSNGSGVTATAYNEGNFVVVTLSWGMKPTGGYLLKIDEAKQVGNTIEVKYTAKAPGPDAIVTQALTYPKATIKVPVDNPNIKYDIVLIE